MIGRPYDNTDSFRAYPFIEDEQLGILNNDVVLDARLLVYASFGAPARATPISATPASNAVSDRIIGVSPKGSVLWASRPCAMMLGEPEARPTLDYPGRAEKTGTRAGRRGNACGNPKSETRNPKQGSKQKGSNVTAARRALFGTLSFVVSFEF